ncbi:oligopeptidase A [Chironomus tepperi]|uniref:oligopeptidase A n=1 Tax=Chironomus tepperi TaxID=113505 RepID=UPI00391EE8D9
MSYLRLISKNYPLLITRTCNQILKRNNGFIVLVPEIGEENYSPIGQHELPEFNNFTIEKCISAVGNQGLAIEKSLKALEDDITSKADITDIFKEVLDPIEEITTGLENTWGLAKTLYLGNSSLMPTKSYLTIHDRACRVRAQKFNSLPVYYAIKKAAKSEAQPYDDQQKRLIQKFLLEGRLNGIEVDGAQKFQLNDHIIKLSENRAKFHNNVEASRRAFQQNCNDPNIIKELPTSLLEMLSVDRTQPASKGPWKLSLQPYVVKSFLEYCPDHNVRWNVWQADVRKCSRQADKQYDNSVFLEEIRFSRRQQAKILGYESYMDMSMETKMAGSVSNVKDVLNRLRECAKPAQDAEIANLQTYAEKIGYHRKLEIQDIPYYRRKQLIDLHDFNEDVIQEYFPLNKVFKNMLKLSEKLFNIKVIERPSVNRWHEDVKFFEVFDLQDGKEPLGGFYVDLYARDEEKTIAAVNSGWMVKMRSKSELTNTRPLLAIIFNFRQIAEKSVLLNSTDVRNLFSKFGLTLQNIICNSRYNELSGSSNVEWDAVEVVGNVMSNLLYDTEILKSITAHYSNEDPLPDKYINAFMQNQKHLAGYNLCRQLYFSDLDVELNTKKDFWWDVVKELYPKYHSVELDKKDSHPCSFTPIVSGEWGGAYYSTVWSELIAADVYSAFWEARKSQNPDDFAEVGKRFRNTFLACGGTLQTNEVFRRFRGRDPSPKALLHNLGLSRPELKK